MTRADLNPSSDPQSSLCASQLVSHLATIFWLFIPYTHSFPAKWPPAIWLKLFNSGRLTHRQNAVGEHRLKLGEPAGKHTRTQRIFSLRLWFNKTFISNSNQQSQFYKIQTTNINMFSPSRLIYVSAFARVTLVITSVHNVTLVTAFNLPTETSIPIWPLTRMKGMSVRSHTPPVHFVHDHLPLKGCLQNQYSGIIKSCILHIVQIHLLQNSSLLSRQFISSLR